MHSRPESFSPHDRAVAAGAVGAVSTAPLLRVPKKFF